MAQEPAELLARFRVPQPDAAVRAAGEDKAAVGGKRDAGNLALVAFQAVQLLSFGVPKPHRAVGAPGKDVAPVRRRGHAHHVVGVPREAAHLVA